MGRNQYTQHAITHSREEQCVVFSQPGSGYVSQQPRVKLTPAASYSLISSAPVGKPTERAHLYINTVQGLAILCIICYVWLFFFIATTRPCLSLFVIYTILKLSNRIVVFFLHPFWSANCYFTHHRLHTSPAHDSTVLCSPSHHPPICAHVFVSLSFHLSCSLPLCLLRPVRVKSTQHE